MQSGSRGRIRGGPLRDLFQGTGNLPRYQFPHARSLQAGYDLFRYLGGGGMGDVYLAREHAAERTVAMKFLRGSPHSNSATRFLTEILAVMLDGNGSSVTVIGQTSPPAA